MAFKRSGVRLPLLVLLLFAPLPFPLHGRNPSLHLHKMDLSQILNMMRVPRSRAQVALVATNVCGTPRIKESSRKTPMLKLIPWVPMGCKSKPSYTKQPTFTCLLFFALDMMSHRYNNTATRGSGSNRRGNSSRNQDGAARSTSTQLKERVATLEEKVAQLEKALEKFKREMNAEITWLKEMVESMMGKCSNDDSGSYPATWNL